MSAGLYTYVVELKHDAGISRLGNAAYREVSSQTHALLPKLMAERGMKMLEMYHLDPQHRAYLILEARRVEDVRDVLYQSKFMHWCEGNIYPVTVMGETAWFDDGPEPGVNAEERAP